MTVINFKIDEIKKKEIEKIAELKGFKSVSDFIRQTIDEKINLQKIIEEFKIKNPIFDREKTIIPDFIPDGKYLGISRNQIVVIGDSAREVAKILFEKFPDSASGIIHKGHETETLDFVFSIFTPEEMKCYQQFEFKNNYYPILPFSIYFDKEEKNLLGLIDTGATISSLDKNIVEDYSIKPIRNIKIYTANDIIEVPVYKSIFQYQNLSIELDFMAMDIKRDFSFDALLGKNFIDKFNLLFLGKEKLFCIQSTM